ncbi:protein of unknown function DUF1365 [Methylocella silvestris BL2]|uniref:DUF1365 domain-containing protein n=1 Tax=Methylocella silvestris (strain DSM 15510 / CIP 108128 / LMG 27833 / NCIMB 13906 / BL2) TaxID=395965 RepID=B8EPW0_METSB|nr:DUF1365 family protein [Methylocella silvestris]ACK50964.1 protein of unknown function DUF1365 [Methylocella silvestris BL2]
MKARASCFYPGIVMHRRLRPRRHRFRYGIFLALFDIDELAALDDELRLFGYNRANVISFYDNDHLLAGAESLRAKVEGTLRLAGLSADGGSIRLLCMPRVFGYVFNPISVYFCYGAGTDLVAILYEVNNTFGEKHVYLFDARGQQGRILQHCPKRLHVSPFMDMELTYKFTIRLPGARMAFNVNAVDSEGVMLATSFSGRRVEFTGGKLLGLIVAYPLMTVKVIAGIHFEALRLWLKGIRLRPSPGPPETSPSVVPLPERDEVRP